MDIGKAGSFGAAMNIGIIGGGPAGIISAIATCNVLKDKNICIDIYEQGIPFKGRAFNTGSENMLLNTSVGVSFIDPAAQNGLLDYVNQHERLNVSIGDVVSRDSAVAYLQRELSLAESHIGKINFISKTVSSIHIDHHNRPCIVNDDKRTAYDAVVIATGLPFKKAPTMFAKRKIISPYPAQQLTDIDRAASILVLGSRLSAIDALAHLAGCGHKGHIDIHSPSQLFPSVRHHVIKPEHREFLDHYLSEIKGLPEDYSRIGCMIDMFKHYLLQNNVRLIDIISAEGRRAATQLDHEIQLCQQNRNVWEDILMDMIDGLNIIWPSLSSTDKTRFNNEVNPWLGRIAHSMPLRNAEIISGLFKSGQLRMLSSDELLTTDLDAYGAIINATGLQSAEADLLLSHLANKQLLQFNGNGGVSINTATHRVSEDFPIYANGSIVQGGVFTANSIYSTSYGAKKIAHDIERLASTIKCHHKQAG